MFDDEDAEDIDDLDADDSLMMEGTRIVRM